MPKRFVVDLSLTLINNTGAYYLSRDLVDHLPDYVHRRRYWRLHASHMPGGILRRLLGREMLFELNHPRLAAWLPTRGQNDTEENPTLFLDPLYILRARFERSDVVLCHDVGPVSNPEFFDPRVGRLYDEAYRRIAAVGPGMVFVSQASRDAFVALYGSGFRFLEVIPLYVRADTHRGPSRAPEGVRKPFLLTVGTKEKRKNYLRSIEAFARSGLQARGYSYVFCGARSDQSEVIAQLAARTPGVQPLGYLDDAELRWLYRHASGFVLPSLLEGFGMPALEAARHGLLSVISHDGALPEAVGGGAILVDPEDPVSIAAGMQQIVDMPLPERRARLAVARAHAAALSLDHYTDRWSQLLGRA